MPCPPPPLPFPTDTSHGAPGSMMNNCVRFGLFAGQMRLILTSQVRQLSCGIKGVPHA